MDERRKHQRAQGKFREMRFWRRELRNYTRRATATALFIRVACDVPPWATIGGQDVDRLPSASTCYNSHKIEI
ncbi:hypothetical protein RJ641_028082 [Dillenia turbinata]|uniref:Uncharacterized protein n=1 Tax=Dillenia turbinata TaxID=194707 RepID=A0AAN8ZR31_9MAGN